MHTYTYILFFALCRAQTIDAEVITPCRIVQCAVRAVIGTAVFRVLAAVFIFRVLR